MSEQNTALTQALLDTHMVFSDDSEELAKALLESDWLADLIRRERGAGWDECSKARRFGLKNNPYTREQETP